MKIDSKIYNRKTEENKTFIILESIMRNNNITDIMEEIKHKIKIQKKEEEYLNEFLEYIKEKGI